MLKKKKLLAGLVTILTLMTLCVPIVYSQNTNSGWDAVSGNGNSTSPQNTSSSTVTPRYKDGDIEKGILKLKATFNEFPSEKRISLKLRNSEVSEVLAEIVREGGKNLIMDNSVDGTITYCELENVTLNEALSLILEVRDLDAKVDGDNIYIAAKQYMKLKGFNRKAIKSFKLNYADPVTLAKILEASIFNVGVDIGSKLTSYEDKGKSASASKGKAAVQATGASSSTANITTDRTTGGVNYQVIYQPESSIDVGGARMYTSDIPEGTQSTDIGVDRTEALSVQAARQSQAEDESSSFATKIGGAITIGKDKKVKATEKSVDSASGYNSGSSQAASIKIQGQTVKYTDHTVSNNNGGPIVIPDTRSKSILVAGIEEDIALAEKTIAALDKPLKQVSIEVSLIEMNRTDAQTLGLTIASGAKAFTGGFNNTIASNNQAYNSPIYTPNSYETTGAGTIQPPIMNPSNWAQTLGIATQLGETALQVSTIKNLTSNIAVRINALVGKKKAKILANPNIVALDDSETLIKLTEQVINRISTTTSSTGVTQTNIDLFDAGVALYVRPSVSNDGYITMRIRPSLTVPYTKQTFAGNELTLIATREVLVENVRVKSGETLALAGLIKENSNSEETRIPMLGDIPGLGKLFRYTKNDKVKTELIILLTPKIIDDIATQVSPLSMNATTAPID